LTRLIILGYNVDETNALPWVITNGISPNSITPCQVGDTVS